MPSWFRKLIAVSQLIGGTLTAVLMLYLVFSPTYRMEAWYFASLQGLAFVGILAGWWLWHDDPRAWAFSRGYQALQIIQLQTATWGAGILSGLFATIYFGSHGAGFNVGFHASANIFVGNGMPWEVRVNLLALAAFVALTWPGWFGAKVGSAREAWDDRQRMSHELDHRPGPPSGHRRDAR